MNRNDFGHDDSTTYIVAAIIIIIIIIIIIRNTFLDAHRVECVDAEVDGQSGRHQSVVDDQLDSPASDRYNKTIMCQRAPKISNHCKALWCF